MSIAENVAAIRAAMESAARDAGRDPKEIKLCAATKMNDAAAVRQSSRRYAKRQLTWFRRNPAVHWLIREDETSGEEIFRSARQIIQEFDK